MKIDSKRGKSRFDSSKLFLSTAYLYLCERAIGMAANASDADDDEEESEAEDLATMASMPSPSGAEQEQEHIPAAAAVAAEAVPVPSVDAELPRLDRLWASCLQ